MRDHKSLKAWILAREISMATLDLCRDHYIQYAGEVYRQLQRSALSIQLNIAEGHALADRGRFGNHLAVAYGSATESADLLELLLDREMIPPAMGKDLLAKIQNSKWLLLGLLKRYRPLHLDER